MSLMRGTSVSLKNVFKGLAIGGVPLFASVFGASEYFGPKVLSPDRAVTDNEIAFAKTLTGPQVDYSNIRVVKYFHNDKLPRGERIPMKVLDEHPDQILVYSESAYCEDYFSNACSAENKGMFVHELTHIWQLQNAVPVEPRGPYRYKLTPDQTFDDYQPEQQAEILRDYTIQYALFRYEQDTTANVDCYLMFRQNMADLVHEAFPAARNRYGDVRDMGPCPENIRYSNIKLPPGL